MSDPVSGKSGFNFGWLAIVLLLVLFISLLFLRSENIRETTWTEFSTTLLSREAVDHVVVVDDREVEVYLRPELKDNPVYHDVFILRNVFGDRINPGPHYRFSIGSLDSFERRLDEAERTLPAGHRKVGVSYNREGNWWITILPWLLPLSMLFLFFRLLGTGQPPGQGTGQSIFSFGRSTARLQEQGGTSPVTFADVAGMEEAKQEVQEVGDFLRDPDRYTKLGARIPKGILIIGPPGTGKTLLAKAVAGEARVPFFSLSGSEFVEMFVGVGASRVRDLFRRAREKAPCIVFIDEIDAVGRSRGKNMFYSGANDERESTLNQLLTEMDGFGTNSGVIVLAATNRADVLDPALLRPGRFDRHIMLELPGLEERKAILGVHLRPLKPAADVDAVALAGQTPGFSGADLANLCNEAALIAARFGKKEVTRADFSSALDRLVAGLERKGKLISPQEKRIIAFHEAGHAVASWFLPRVDPVLKVSVIPRGKTLGAAWYLPAERQIRTVSEFIERLSAWLAGRAAEEVTFGEVSSGALDDLEKVTREAYQMVVFFGFNSKVGNISFFDSSGRTEPAIQKPYSEETARLIDEEVRKLVDQAYRSSLALLREHRDKLNALAARLLAREVVEQPELVELLGKRMAPREMEPAPMAVSASVPV